MVLLELYNIAAFGNWHSPLSSWSFFNLGNEEKHLTSCDSTWKMQTSSFCSFCILNIFTCSVRLLRIYVLNSSKKFPSLAWLTDLDVDWPTLSLPLDMCLHVSQISSNDNWYTSPLLMRSRRSIHSSLIVLSKRVFSVSGPKWCSFSLLMLYMNLSIRS